MIEVILYVTFLIELWVFTYLLRNMLGWTPLMWAAQANKAQAVDVLLKHKAGS